MQIVIDIPEEVYKRVLDGKWEGNPLADYIEDGTPLPNNELENPFNDSRFGG